MHRKSIEAAEQLKSPCQSSETSSESCNSVEDLNVGKEEYVNNNIIRRHSSIASLRAKAQEHLILYSTGQIDNNTIN